MAVPQALSTVQAPWTAVLLRSFWKLPGDDFFFPSIFPRFSVTVSRKEPQIRPYLNVIIQLLCNTTVRYPLRRLFSAQFFCASLSLGIMVTSGRVVERQTKSTTINTYLLWWFLSHPPTQKKEEGFPDQWFKDSENLLSLKMHIDSMSQHGY